MLANVQFVLALALAGPAAAGLVQQRADNCSPTDTDFASCKGVKYNLCDGERPDNGVTVAAWDAKCNNEAGKECATQYNCTWNASYYASQDSS